MPALKARVAELQAKFVDTHLRAEHADPLNYAANADDLAAFRLLIHGELEEYLENKAREGLAAMEAAFNSGRKSVRDNLSLIVIARVLKLELRFESVHWPHDIRDILLAAREWISKNNGIKEASFTMLSIFSGRMPDEIDAALSAGLSSYGAARGDVAHRSVARVRTIYSPSAENKAASDLVSALEAYFA
ncbi:MULTISPECIES: hypothetical protein [Burkholderia cepacia complex]|uniref:hypothetical protein n=1 Tax=Burkholderia cepacia complex TaxID=87882 RepID=UPI000F55AC4C|nr:MULTISPECIES: hypothetical protein [Burkholderia cepacia complex]MBR8213953.1 hypothetical protein [Burkholderia vietnamiensis]